MRRFYLLFKLYLRLILAFFMKSIIFLLVSFFSFLNSAAQTDGEKKNSIAGITFSFPWINHYNYVDHHNNILNRKFGFFGLGFSGYYKNGINKISFGCSTTEDLSSPIATINYSKKDIKTNIGSSYFELIYHRPIQGDLNLFAGFNFTNYIFRLSSTIDSVSSYKKVDQTLGISIGLEYRFNNYYSVAGVYRPAFASFETDSKYRHLINLELRIDLDFSKKKKMNNGSNPVNRAF